MPDLYYEQISTLPAELHSRLGHIAAYGLSVYQLADPTSRESAIFQDVFASYRATKADFKREDRGWLVDDSHLSRFFDGVKLRNGTPLEVMAQCIGRDPNNVGIDIAGGTNGVAMRDLVATGLVGKGLYTHFLDDRNPRLSNPNVDLVTGDLATAQPWLSIRDWQQRNAPQGFAVALHAPGLGFEKWAPDTHLTALAMLLPMMQPGAVIFTQVPIEVLKDGNQEARLDFYRAARRLPQVVAIELAESNKYGSTGYNFCVVYVKASPKPDSTPESKV